MAASFPIQTVAERTGLTPHVIRAWERRYRAIEPERSAGKHRLYSEAEIERIGLLYRAVRSGHSIGKIAKLPTEELREYTRIIIGEADRLAALTDSLLGPARSLRRELVNIHEILERVCALIGSEAPPGVAIVRDYDPSLPPIPVDRDQMLQAVLNIARNALQALTQGNEEKTNPAGRIILRTRALTNWIIGNQRHKVIANVEIEDDGPGVSAELGDSIFYPLVSGHPGGTGLGLPLAQEILSRHGGLIEYRSRPGQTVFMLRLPMEAAGTAGSPP